MSHSGFLQERLHRDPFGSYFKIHGTKHHQSFQKDYNSSCSLLDAHEKKMSIFSHKMEGKILHLRHMSNMDLLHQDLLQYFHHK